jgi:hypothetical protein
MPETIKAISLYQPWATLVAIGAKKIETRSWSTNYRGPLAIHAAKKWTGALKQIALDEPFKSALAGAVGQQITFLPGSDCITLPLGKIVAVCRLANCLRAEAVTRIVHVSAQELAFGDFEAGRFAWMLDNVRPLFEPVAYTGERGFFDVPYELLTASNHQMQ